MKAPRIPREDDFRSPAHVPAVSARTGLWLGVAFTLCFLTGLASHFIQHPTGWFGRPTRPVSLYRVTQGVHVLSGVAAWLLAGPIVHDAVVAPLIGLAGLLLLRLLPARTVRWWVTAGLAVTGTLVLVTVPLLWRPNRAAANPGLQDHDYLTGLAVWLGVIWAAVILGALLSPRSGSPVDPHAVDQGDV